MSTSAVILPAAPASDVEAAALCEGFHVNADGWICTPKGSPVCYTWASFCNLYTVKDGATTCRVNITIEAERYVVRDLAGTVLGRGGSQANALGAAYGAVLRADAMIRTAESYGVTIDGATAPPSLARSIEDQRQRYAEAQRARSADAPDCSAGRHVEGAGRRVMADGACWGLEFFCVHCGALVRTE